jgi:acyl carrier protein
MQEKSKIRNFIRDLLIKVGDDRPLSDQDSLLESGRLQSIDAVEIIVFLEENFGIDFGSIGFDRDRIDSIDAIHALTQSKVWQHC